MDRCYRFRYCQNRILVDITDVDKLRCNKWRGIMKLNLDLPKYKWQILFNHLRHYREDETVNTFCCVIEGLESDKQFPMKMYQFLS